MRNFKVLFLIFLSVCLLSSCGIFKKSVRTKSKELTTSKTETKIKEENSIIERDKTVTIETEKAKGQTKTTEEKVTNETAASLKDLAAGLTTMDSSLVSVKITLDTLTNKIKTEVVVKPRVVVYDVDKSKTTYADKITETKQNKQTDNKELKTSKIVATENKKEPAGLGYWWAGIVVIVVAVFLLVRRYLPKFNLPK